MQGKHRISDQAIAPSELILRPDGSIYHLGIRPGQIATKIIIVGDPERVPMITSHFDSIEFQVASREFVVHTGTFSGKRLTVVSSGIGVDNIDILINELDAVFNIDFETRRVKEEMTQLEFVRIGTSGAMQPDIPTGSFVASQFAFALDGVPYSYTAQHSDKEQLILSNLKHQFKWLQDQDTLYVAGCDPELVVRIAFDFHQGITATANGFYGPQGRSLRLQSVMEERIDDYASFSLENLRITNFEMECAGIYALASMLGHKALTVCAILANRATKEFHKNPSASIESLITIVLQRF